MKSYNKIFNNVVFVLFIFSAGINTFFIKKKCFKVNSEESNLSKNNYNIIIDMQDQIHSLLTQDSLEFISQNSILPKEIDFISVNNTNINITEIIKRPKIIIYWDYRYCDECYESFFKALNKPIPINAKVNYIFIGNFITNREFQYFIKSNEIECESYLIKDIQSFDIPISKGEFPFVFLIDSNYRTSSYFTVYKGNGALNSLYLKKLNEIIEIQSDLKKQYN